MCAMFDCVPFLNLPQTLCDSGIQALWLLRNGSLVNMETSKPFVLRTEKKENNRQIEMGKERETES